MDYIVISLENLLDRLGENEEKLINCLKRFSCQMKRLGNLFAF